MAGALRRDLPSFVQVSTCHQTLLRDGSFGPR